MIMNGNAKAAQFKLLKALRTNGNKVVVNKKKTKELINVHFEVNKFDYQINISEIKYIQDKLLQYEQQLIHVIKLLKIDRNSRQAVIVFDQNTDKPNCVVSTQFIIRNNLLYCICNSRSMDIKNKMFTDIEIARLMCSDILQRFTKVKLHSIFFKIGSAHYYE